MVNQLATSGQVQPQPGGIREVLHALKRSSDSSDGSGSEKERKLPRLKYSRGGSRFCVHAGCATQATFGTLEGGATWCAAHKVDGAADQRSRICDVAGCARHAKLGVPGASVTHCAIHAGAGTKRHPRTRCAVTDCDAPAVFGHDGARRGGLHCNRHREDGELEQVLQRCGLRDAVCQSCAQPAARYASRVGDEPRFCEDCKADSDVDVGGCGLPYFVNASGLCPMCDPHNVRRFFLKKQCYVRDRLLESDMSDFDGYDCLVEKGDCGLQRPDFWWEAEAGHCVVLEVDENQHQSYASDCERIRMLNIAETLFQRPTVFVRYNPDRYKPRGSATLEDGQGPRERIQLLIDVLRKVRNKFPLPSEDAISVVGFRFRCMVVKLFFDGWHGSWSPQEVLPPPQ